MDNKLKLCGDYTTWNNVPFEDIVDRVSTPKKSGNLPYVEFEDIISGEGILNKNIYERHNVKNGIYFVKGDILFGKLRPYLKNILLADFNGIAVGDFWVLRSHRVLPYILYLVVNSNKFMRIANISSGSKMPRSDWAIVSKAMIAIPKSIEEQLKIASYFQSLDSLIQTTSKKLASLKRIKAASLQSMFPQEGETVPKIRFNGFEGEWDFVTAGEVFRTTNVRNRPDLPVLSATQDKGMVKRSDIGYQVFHDKSNETTYKHILPGQFIIHLRSFQGGFAHSNIEGIVSPAYTVMEFKNKEFHYDYFWKYIFTSKEFIKRLELITYGIRDGRTISFDEFKEMDFFIPSKLEQQKIASYFCNLDKQISLQTQRLEKLKQIKAACLDKMFV